MSEQATAQRKGESLSDAAQRVATDAVYEARDNGGTMHAAGELAADRVLALALAQAEREKWELVEAGDRLAEAIMRDARGVTAILRGDLDESVKAWAALTKEDGR